MLTPISSNLMAKDEFKNLGFGDDKVKPVLGPNKAQEEEGKKGELRW